MLKQHTFYADGVFINEFMVRQGYAKTLIIPPDNKYSEILFAAENGARENSRGMWNECPN